MVVIRLFGWSFSVSSPMQLDLGFWNDSLVGGDLRVVHQRLFPDAVGPWDFALFYWKFVKLNDYQTFRE